LEEKVKNIKPPELKNWEAIDFDNQEYHVDKRLQV